MDLIIVCEFCSQTPLSVVESRCCSRIYCWDCVLSNSYCKCGKRINTSEVEIVPELQNIIEENVIENCKNDGCIFFSNRKNMEQHKRDCVFRLVPCQANPHVCGMYMFKDLEAHQNYCPYVYVTCAACGKYDTRIEIENHECPEQLDTCICGEQVKLKYISNHKKQYCPETIIPCPYSQYGCDFSDQRANMHIHLNENNEGHVNFVNSVVSMKDQQINQLNKQLNVELNKPFCAEMCTIGRKIGTGVISCVPQSQLFKRGNYLLENCTKQVLFKILFLFFIATLLPMKFFIIRLFFTFFVMKKVWVVLFAPAIRAARNPYCRPAIEQIIYLVLFAVLSVLFLLYTKYV